MAMPSVQVFQKASKFFGVVKVLSIVLFLVGLSWGEIWFWLDWQSGSGPFQLFMYSRIGCLSASCVGLVALGLEKLFDVEDDWDEDNEESSTHTCIDCYSDGDLGTLACDDTDPVAVTITPAVVTIDETFDVDDTELLGWKERIQARLDKIEKTNESYEINEVFTRLDKIEKTLKKEKRK